MTTIIDTTPIVYQDRASELARYLGGLADPERAAEAAAIVRVLAAVNVNEMLAAATALVKACHAQIYPRNSLKPRLKAEDDWESKLGCDPLKAVALATLLEHCCRRSGMKRATSWCREAAICVYRPELTPVEDRESFAGAKCTKARKKALHSLKDMIEKPPASIRATLDEIATFLG